MAKIGLAATKYIIKSSIKAEGVVERPDVIGAVFGQTEGLLGEGLDLRELQKGGRIGRIEVTITSKEGKSDGTIEIPTSLSKEDTALIAASLETIERVGPCNAKITVNAIEDVRTSKRDYVVDRAKALLGKMGEAVPESQELNELVKETVRVSEITKYGPDNLPAGSNIDISKDIILVEGRADVVNLLKHGIMNVVGLGGTSIPKSVKGLCEKKTITVFLDGDRGGDLILKELTQVASVEFVARAPIGREVEELTQKEIIKSLRNKIPVQKALAETETKSQRRTVQRPTKVQKAQTKTQVAATKPRDEYVALVKSASGLRAGQALLLKQKGTGFIEIGKVPKADISDVLKNLQEGSAQALIVSWDVDQSLVNEAGSKGIKYVIGKRKPRTLKRKQGMYVFELSYLKRITSEGGK